MSKDVYLKGSLGAVSTLDVCNFDIAKTAFFAKKHLVGAQVWWKPILGQCRASNAYADITTKRTRYLTLSGASSNVYELTNRQKVVIINARRLVKIVAQFFASAHICDSILN